MLRFPSPVTKSSFPRPRPVRSQKGDYNEAKYPRHSGDDVDVVLTERCKGASGSFSIDALFDVWRGLGRDPAELGRGNNGNKRMTAGILIRSAIARGDMTLGDLRQ
jgi:hypothetical protein